jgi:hypothetical protein
MTDRGGYWPGRRVLVLGCTGFVGTWLVRGLLARGAEVIGLVRNSDCHSDFFRDKLYQRVHVVRGRADDLPRLRSLVDVYDVQSVFQFAAGPTDSGEAVTRTVLRAAGSAAVVLPSRPGTTLRPRPANASADLTVARLPVLFGGGDCHWDRWPPRLLLAASRTEPLPLPPASLSAAPVAPAREATGELLNTLAETRRITRPVGLREVAVRPYGTGADLFAAASQVGSPGPRLHRAGATGPGTTHLDEAVEDAVEWYRSSAVRPEWPGRRAAA